MVTIPPLHAESYFIPKSLPKSGLVVIMFLDASKVRDGVVFRVRLRRQEGSKTKAVTQRERIPWTKCLVGGVFSPS